MGKNIKHIIFSICMLLLLFVNNSNAHSEVVKNSTNQRFFTAKKIQTHFLHTTTFHYSYIGANDIDTSSSDDNEDEGKDASEIALLAQNLQQAIVWHLNTSINNKVYNNQYQGIIIALATPPPQV